MTTSARASATVVDREDIRRAHGFHALPVKAVVQETGDTRSFVLAVPGDLSEVFRYRPGQFCAFRVRVGDDEHLRSYSMSSAPEIDRDLTVTVKRVPGGLVSNWLHDNVSEGAVLEATRPAGIFCPRTTEVPVVAFCGGSGVTPVMSIVKSVLHGTNRTVKLLYANRDRSSVIFESALQDLCDHQCDRFEVRHHFDSEGGYLRPETIANFAGDALEADFYICGPGPFMDLVEQALLQLGIDPANILIERFETGEAPPSKTEPSGTGAEALRAVTLILRGKPTTVPYRAGDTVLETARRAGLQPPFSCEAGNCATCMALLRKGAATMRANNALTPAEVEEGWILTCQAVPLGPAVVVEYEAL